MCGRIAWYSWISLHLLTEIGDSFHTLYNIILYSIQSAEVTWYTWHIVILNETRLAVNPKFFYITWDSLHLLNKTRNKTFIKNQYSFFYQAFRAWGDWKSSSSMCVDNHCESVLLSLCSSRTASALSDGSSTFGSNPALPGTMTLWLKRWRSLHMVSLCTCS